MGNSQGSADPTVEVASTVLTAIVTAFTASLVSKIFRRERENKDGTPPKYPPRIKDVYWIDTMIAKSKDYTYGEDWYDALVKWFDILAPQGARVSVITGTHGTPQGNLTRYEKFQGRTIDASQFVQHDIKHIEKLKRVKKQEIKDRNIVFDIVDVFDPLLTNKNKTVNPEKLGKRISEFQPTAVILAYCHSEVSEMNKILEKAGVTTNLFIHQDRMHVSGKRYEKNHS